jgi:hypothetical protein
LIMNQKVSVPGQIPDLPKELIPDFIEIQKLKMLNESKKLQLKEKEMDYVSKYSEKMLDHHIQMMNQGSLENRKSFTRLGLIVGILTLIVLGFLTAWICLGKEQFAFKFLQGMAYLLSTVLGYWIGIKSKARKSEKKQVAAEQAETVE